VSVRGREGVAVLIDFKEVRAFRDTDEGERTTLVEQMPPKNPVPRALVYEIEESPFVQWSWPGSVDTFRLAEKDPPMARKHPRATFGLRSSS
jgi:hypothetical protein